MRIQLPDGEYRNELRQPIWDVNYLAAGVNPLTAGILTFFNNVSGKTLSQTNLKQNGQLEADVSFRCLGLQLDAQNNDPANYGVLPLIMERSYLDFKITNQSFYTANASFACGRVQQVSALAAGAVTERLYQKYGDVAVQAVGFSGKHVIDLGSLQSFLINFQTDNLVGAEIAAATPASRIQLLCSLKGLQRRPVL